jgi:hypothetical protein
VLAAVVAATPRPAARVVPAAFPRPSP